MLKKLIPLVLMVFISACSNVQTNSQTATMPCCQECELCKSGKCDECCKGDQCACCKGGDSKMCMKADKSSMKGGMSSMKEGEECPMCAKAEREWKAKHGTMKH